MNRKQSKCGKYHAGQNFRVGAEEPYYEGREFVALHFEDWFGRDVVISKNGPPFYADDVAFAPLPVSRPVYPFKAGDVVVCKDARHTPDGCVSLTEGSLYTVVYVIFCEPNKSPHAVVKNDLGSVFPYQAARFCAPDEYTDMRINSVASGLRDQLDAANARADRAERETERVKGMLARATDGSEYRRIRDLEVQLAGETKVKDKLAAGYSDMVDQRNLWVKKFEALRETFRALHKACE